MMAGKEDGGRKVCKISKAVIGDTGAGDNDTA